MRGAAATAAAGAAAAAAVVALICNTSKIRGCISSASLISY